MKTLHAFPATGFNSVDYDTTSNTLLLGDGGNLYRLSNGISATTLSLITQTGENSDINNLVVVSNGNALFSTGGKLNLFLGDMFQQEISSNVVSIGNTITIMDLGDETITDILKIEDTGSLLIATSDGRIIGCGTNIINAYLTGQRNIYGDVKDGVGFSNSASSLVEYALYQRIAEINESKEIERWKFEQQAAIYPVENLTGIFIGPIVHVKADLGFWKGLIWEEIKPTNTGIMISLRSGNSTEEVLASNWNYAFTSLAGEVSPITRELNDITLTGAYLQVKVEMIANTALITPVVSKVTVNYSTKQASYFFTTKFALAQNSGSQTGLLVATMTEPQSTEIHFGIAQKDSGDWQDYTTISPDKLFEIVDPQNLKIGIKFVSYDTNVPEVAEFALTIGGENKKKLNDV